MVKVVKVFGHCLAWRFTIAMPALRPADGLFCPVCIVSLRTACPERVTQHDAIQAMLSFFHLNAKMNVCLMISFIDDFDKILSKLRIFYDFVTL